MLMIGAAAPALAQTDTATMAQVAAANQLGVLEYCQTQGFVDAATVSAEKDVIARMPASPASTGDAEALGKQGTLAAPSGSQTSIASLASAQHTTVSALCGQVGSGAVQSAAMLKQNGVAAGGMPTMSAMPSGVPAMPGGMPAMPGAMPNMPAMPGIAPSK